jgi:hypothetical protein
MLNLEQRNQVLFTLYERTATNIAYNIMYTVAVETNKITRDGESVHFIQSFSADLINEVQKITLTSTWSNDAEINLTNEKIERHIIDQLLTLQNKFDFTPCEYLINEIRIDIVQFLSISSYIRE